VHPARQGSPLFELGDDEMEMGVGIHGEPGRRREKLASANEIVDELLEAVVTDLPFAAGDDVALMVNGLGGTPISELYLLYGYAHELLAQRGINVRRNYVGNYCTSLDMARDCSPPPRRSRSGRSDRPAGRVTYGGFNWARRPASGGC
jgi:phosphoenolpyruvate---glycerone phosphotransferase subunit DhaK